MTYVRDYIDARGDIIDRDYYCSATCCHDGRPGGLNDPLDPGASCESGWWPCPCWPDYDVYCASCNELLHAGEDVCGVRQDARDGRDG
jgi:hypothetical protein